jgi:hypothetical protein
MKKLSILLFFLIISTFCCAQTVKYLASGADLQSEIDGAVPGDTFIIGPGTYAGNTNVTKRVTLIGPGYFNSTGPSGEAAICGAGGDYGDTIIYKSCCSYIGGGGC